jgi:hypothetical protein
MLTASDALAEVPERGALSNRAPSVGIPFIEVPGTYLAPESARAGQMAPVVATLL